MVCSNSVSLVFSSIEEGWKMPLSHAVRAFHCFTLGRLSASDGKTLLLDPMFFPQRFPSGLADQLVDGGMARREDGVEHKTPVFGYLITMSEGELLHQAVS